MSLRPQDDPDRNRLRGLERRRNRADLGDWLPRSLARRSTSPASIGVGLIVAGVVIANLFSKSVWFTEPTAMRRLGASLLVIVMGLRPPRRTTGRSRSSIVQQSLAATWNEPRRRRHRFRPGAGRRGRRVWRTVRRQGRCFARARRQQAWALVGLQRVGPSRAGFWPERQSKGRRRHPAGQHGPRLSDARRNDDRSVADRHAEVRRRRLDLARQIQHARRRRPDAAHGRRRRDDFLEHRLGRAGERRDAALHHRRHRDGQDRPGDVHADGLRSPQCAGSRRDRASIRARHDDEPLRKRFR